MRAVAAGALFVVAHAAAFALVYRRCGRGTDLAVEVRSPIASPTLTLEGAVPEGLRDRVRVEDTEPGAGLHHRTWRVSYRGGVERAVGATQLVGPFQDPAAPACSGRISIDQDLLDHGTGSNLPGTLGHEVERELVAALRGTSIFGAGDFVRVEKFRIEWADLESSPDDASLFGKAGAPLGYVRASARVVFSRVAIPIVVAITPEVRGGQLELHTRTRAQLAFENRAAQWVSEHVGGDWLATKLARRELDASLLAVFAPPPPLDIGDGTTLRFAYCSEPIDFRGARATLPFAVIIGRGADARVLPPHLPRVDLAQLGPHPTRGNVAIDLDLDALNALLYELWRGGTLDRAIARAGLDRQFNENPTVEEMLSLRLAGPPTLALPPVLSLLTYTQPRDQTLVDTLLLSVDGRVTLGDGDAAVRGRVFGTATLQLSSKPPWTLEGKPDGPSKLVLEWLSVQGLELSCERSPTVLAPCYGDLVAAMRNRTVDLNETISAAFGAFLSEIFVERHVAAPGVPAQLVIHAASPDLVTHDGAAMVRIGLDATIER